MFNEGKTYIVSGLQSLGWGKLIFEIQIWHFFFLNFESYVDFGIVRQL
jgi:hypothetical protein